MSDPLTEPADTDINSVVIWDLPLRLCHWSFALLIPAMWWTAENSVWAWHKRLGLILLGVLTFRILWGFAGPRTARFAEFLRGPGKVVAYLRGKLPDGPAATGHNPAGGWSAIALLCAMLFQASLGLFAGDPYDGATGPLNALVGVMTADWITDLHETFFWVVVALIGLHLSAILYYEIIRKERIAKRMVTGRGVDDAGIEGIEATPYWKIALGVAISVGLVLWIANGAPPVGS